MCWSLRDPLFVMTCKSFDKIKGERASIDIKRLEGISIRTRTLNQD